VTSYLYSRGYEIIDIKEYYQNEFKDAVMAWTKNPHQEIKKESFEILQYFNKNSIILKEIGQIESKKIFKNGFERPLGIVMYNTDSKNKSYIYEGISFSFVEKIIYKFPKKQEEFKNGMIVECYSNNGWIKKTISNIDIEYKNLYKTLSKYNKVRITI
jgi:hypothetical protein